jgi:hypothetical protein
MRAENIEKYLQANPAIPGAYFLLFNCWYDLDQIRLRHVSLRHSDEIDAAPLA